MNIEEILLFHAGRYPLMTPQDAVKLLYQHAFGPGHLLKDPQKAKDYLMQEHAALPPAAPQPPEPIGNGLVRVYLGGLEAAALEELFRAFYNTAATFQGDTGLFNQGLEVLKRLTAEGKMPFAPDALHTYLTAYRAAGCPMVSHSAQYRQAYAPAYRVVKFACGK